MYRRVSLGVALSVCLFAPIASNAADLPVIRLSEQNAVPECATPGRLMAFIRAKNPNLEPAFQKIAVEYMRKGEEVGVRWDLAFVQMAIETSYLTFKRDGKRYGDVKPDQNNFAGLGATGRGVPGESFPDMPTGVLAHLQHVLMYSGEKIENPVAERTRKVQQWGVLKSFHAGIKGPVTYVDLARKWAASADYAEVIESHTERFYQEYCSKPDPAPELLAEARGVPSRTDVAAIDKAKASRQMATELAQKAIEEGKSSGASRRQGIGLGPVAAVTAEKPADLKAAAPPITVLNAPGRQAEAPAAPAREPEPKLLERRMPFVTASAAGALARAATPPKATPSEATVPAPPGVKCRVWTASYGGQKSVIIKARSDSGVNYTVLDVNGGAERREAQAYIRAYAKGGEIAGEFQSQSQALEKAFELCPEG